ncbi:3-phenylpropionate/cinnamic acid dioxygenase small subunit [Variovorax boronicumulans]|uniref:aromatic-ring-hydroxylating dioxygenase subunit beta n=1 Tax=Variovorax boronicumulans TaxID=436515 RepID=UPI002786067E|nr:aromatic-ring-hydroxylating dioxygenase subunit beta [Variovorax boronicumulans]MDP9920521.1 3-phenylpropionate/cinnamic acid dioxygenase small subunit [Variovorax boronicumulans]
MNVEDLLLHHEVSQFIYREARHQDNHEYDAWEALWTDDGVYWIPANGEAGDPDQEMSIIYDNRSRIALRVRQFHTGKRYSQSPRSPLRRVISNVEVLENDGTDLVVTANAIVFEAHARGDTLWGSRNEYRLRREDGVLRMAGKKVVLTNNERALYSMAFLI